MEACGGLEYWEITFVCANSVTFLCKTKDLRCYNETRNKWQNRELTIKAWNDIQVFLLNDGFRSLSSILETSSFNHITSLINTEALTKLTMNQKSTKNNLINNNNNNNNINVNNVKNTTKSKKEPNLINQIGLALREKMKTDESQKCCKNESQLELEYIAFGKMPSKNLTNGKKMESKIEKNQHKERTANPKIGPVCSLQASSKASNQILSSNKKIMMLKTALPDKKIEPQVQDEKSKAEKKKEKKQRQKEKKKDVNGDKNGELETEGDDAKLEIFENERSNESLENLQEECRRLKDIIKNGLLEKAKEKNKIESKPVKKEEAKRTSSQDKIVVDENATDEENELVEELERSKEDSMADDIEFDDKEMPAFIKSSLCHKSGKKDEVKLPKKITKKEKEKAPWVPCHNSDQDDLKSIIMALKTDKACLDKACEATMKGKWKLAVACFTKAIELQPSNMGHYLNRCFYYLRTNAYNLALNDAIYVTQKSDNVYQVALAKFRAGQVWYAMKNFDKAERCMSESVELFPDNLTFLRELFYIRMKQLVAMGFPWKATIQVLYKTDSFADACNELSQGKVTGEHEPPLISITRDSEIYFSDDDGDVDCVESLTNLTLNHCKRKTSATNKNLDNKFVTSINSPLRKKVNIPKNVLREQNAKALPVIKDPVINYKNYEDKVLFIGNLTSSVTSTQIKKKFNCYGKILSIIQPPGVNYAFVNFENPIPLKDVLTKECDCKINGVKITVRPKPKKR